MARKAAERVINPKELDMMAAGVAAYIAKTCFGWKPKQVIEFYGRIIDHCQEQVDALEEGE